MKPAQNHANIVLCTGRSGRARQGFWLSSRALRLGRSGGAQVATGTYSNCFRVLNSSEEGAGPAAGGALLEASRDPQRRRLQAAKVRCGRDPRLLAQDNGLLGCLLLSVLSDGLEPCCPVPKPSSVIGYVD